MASNTIEQALYTRLVSTDSSTSVNDAVGNRIFLVTAEQGTPQPYCTYFAVSDPHDPMYFDKAQTGQVRMQFNVYDNDRYNCLDVSHAIRDNLDQFQGSMDGVNILALNCSGVIQRASPESDNNFGYMFDAIIQYVDP